MKIAILLILFTYHPSIVKFTHLKPYSLTTQMKCDSLDLHPVVNHNWICVETDAGKGRCYRLFKFSSIIYTMMVMPHNCHFNEVAKAQQLLIEVSNG